MLHQASFRRIDDLDASPPLGVGVDAGVDADVAVAVAAVAMAGSWSWCFTPPSGIPSAARLAIVNNVSVFASTSCCRCRFSAQNMPRPKCQALCESRIQNVGIGYLLITETSRQQKSVAIQD